MRSSPKVNNPGSAVAFVIKSLRARPRSPLASSKYCSILSLLFIFELYLGETDTCCRGSEDLF